MEPIIIGKLLMMSVTTLIKYKKSENASDVLKEMLLLKEKQEELFQSLKLEIKSLQEGPFYTGLIYLKEANKLHGTEEERKENLVLARQQFISCLGILNAKKNKSSSEFYQIGFIQSYVGFCWLLLSKPLDANNWFTDSLITIEESLSISTREIDENKIELVKERNIKIEFEEKFDKIDWYKTNVIDRAFIFAPYMKVGNDYTFKLMKKLSRKTMEKRLNELEENIHKRKVEILTLKQYQEAPLSYKNNLEIIVNNLKSIHLEN